MDEIDFAGPIVSTALPDVPQPIEPELTEEDVRKDRRRKLLFEFQEASTRLRHLIHNFASIGAQTEVNRKFRNFDIDPELLRKSKALAQDETMVNIRTINSNIEREQPPYINFLRNSRRLVTFTRKEGLDKLNTEQLEEEFYRVMTYTGWEEPFHGELDGAQTHGWDAVEVIFDDSKPGHVGIDHIGHESLIFPLDSLHIQAQEVIIRQYSLTLSELDDFVTEFNFDATEVSKIVDSRKESQSKVDENVTIYKMFFRWERKVYSAWFSLENGCSQWLRAPELHYVGLDEKVMGMTPPVIDPFTGIEVVPGEPTESWQPKALEIYPIFVLRYRKTEQKKIIETKGRAYLDKPKQEALTALWSGYVNGATRASNVFASPKLGQGTGAAPKQLETTILPGEIYTEPLEFWSPPYPDESMLRAAQALDVQNSQEVGQINFAVQNKKGSRTTAKEVQAAEQQNQLLNSVQLTLFSAHIREVYSFVWSIIQSRAIQGKIIFLAIVPGEQEVDPMSGMPLPIVWHNDIEQIDKIYDIRAAGDVDVIQRAEKLQMYQQFWDLVQATSIAPMFLSDMLKIAFPEKGDQYAQQIQQAQQDKQLIERLAQLVKSLMTPEIRAELPPESQQMAQQLDQEVQQSLQQVA